MARVLLRRNDNEGKPSSAVLPLAITLTCLIVAILALVGLLFYMRRKRLARRQQLPLYNEKRTSVSSTNSSHRRIMARPSKSTFVQQERGSLMSEPYNPPDSTLPEIRITFPEEYDSAGKRTSGRCVVVRVGEQGAVGLEPVNDNLPAYQEKEYGRFETVDLDRIGGLVEKARNAPRPT